MAHPSSSFEEARSRAQDAGADGDWPQAARWAERAWRLAGRRPLASLELAAVLAKTDDDRTTKLLQHAAEHYPDFSLLIALAAFQNRDGARRAAQTTMHRLLTTAALQTLVPVVPVANEIATWAGQAGWLGWRGGQLVFGTAHGSPQRVDFFLNRRKLELDWVAEGQQVWSAAIPPEARGSLRATPPLLGAPLRLDLFRKVEGSVTQDGNRVHGWVCFPHDRERQPGVTLTLSRRGHSTERTISGLTVIAPTEAEPFARRWTFSLTVPVGATLTGAREAGSGSDLSLVPTPHELRPAPSEPLAVAVVRSASDDLLLPFQSRDCVLLVTHDEGGGIERHVQERLTALRRAGKVGLLLRSLRDHPGTVQLDAGASAPTFALPLEAPALHALLGKFALGHIEYHQPRRHDDLVRQLAASLRLPYDVYLHDYALLCPRATFVSADGAYCGERPVAQCGTCLQSFPNRDLFAPDGVAALRHRSAGLLAGARRVWAPSADTASRFRRHIPERSITVRPWQVDGPARGRAVAGAAHAHVCVVGAINEHKGFKVLLECARDAAVRQLPIRFTVVGHTIDDAALIGAGVFITGPYVDAECDELIARQRPTIGFLPSIWPEPWCYSLTGLLKAGLPTICFDIGAQAERVRGAGGKVLPLGTAAPRINQQFLKLIQPISTEPELVVV